MTYFDLTHTLSKDTPVSPYDDKILFQHTKNIARDGYNDTQITTTMHIGTHIDAPSHMIDNAKYIDKFPIDKFFGQGIVLNYKDEKLLTVKPEFVKLDFNDKIVLLYTDEDKTIGSDEYYKNHPIISEELCDFLIEKQIKMIGLDFFSPDQFPSIIHKKFLSEDILIIENLCNLDQLLGVNHFEVILLPIKIKAEGAFIRAVARTT